MLNPWLNSTVKVQRRAANPARNTLNEPIYGAESAWTIIYNNLLVRIEYEPEVMQWTDTGERVNPNANKTFLYVDDTLITTGVQINLQYEDRITVLSADDPSIVGRLYIAVVIFGEWDSMGNRHHSIVQLQVH